MSRYIDANKLAKVYMAKGKDKLRLANALMRRSREKLTNGSIAPNVAQEWTVNNLKTEKYKCDRCQKEYEPYKRFETETNINEYGIHRKIIDTHYFNRVGLLYADGIYKDCDLCEDCAKALLKWLEYADKT